MMHIELIGIKVDILSQYDNKDGTSHVNLGIMVVLFHQDYLGKGKHEITMDKLFVLACECNINHGFKRAMAEYFVSA